MFLSLFSVLVLFNLDVAVNTNWLPFSFWNSWYLFIYFFTLLVPQRICWHTSFQNPLYFYVLQALESFLSALSLFFLCLEYHFCCESSIIEGPSLVPSPSEYPQHFVPPGPIPSPGLVVVYPHFYSPYMKSLRPKAIVTSFHPCKNLWHSECSLNWIK